MRIAALDVGSNSFHLMVAEVETGGTIKVLDRAKEMVRLGRLDAAKGVIPPDVFRRGLDALKALRRIADRHKVDALVAVATSAVREAQNGGEFVRAARDEAGIDVRVIRGDEEARLIYLGARGSLDLGKRRVALFDLGGGSLEVILADAQELYFTASLKLGVIRLAESYPCADPPTSRERALLAERVRAMLEPVVSRVRAMGFDFVAFTSGTASALASVLRADPEAHGGKTTIPLRGSGRARAAARDGDARRARRRCRASTRAAPTRSTPARSCTADRARAGGRGRGGAVRDRAARGDHRRVRRQQPPRDPAGRRVPRPAAAHDHGAGPPLRVPRGPRHAGGAAGAVDLRSDAAAAPAGRRATPSCSSTRRSCTTSGFTSHRTATTGTAPT